MFVEDHLVDAIACGGYNYYFNDYFPRYIPAVISPYHKKCRLIEEKLKEFDIDCTVSRVHIGEINYYKVEINHTKCFRKYGDEICEIFDIPHSIVGLVEYKVGECSLYIIDENTFNYYRFDENGDLNMTGKVKIVRQMPREGDCAKFGDGSIREVKEITVSDNRCVILFEDEFDFREVVENHSLTEMARRIRKQLEDYGFNISSVKCHPNMILQIKLEGRNGCYRAKDIRKALGLMDKVDETSCVYATNSLIMMNIDEILKTC